MADSTITLLVLAGVVVLFVVNRFPVEIVAIGSALALYAAGVLTLPQALAGFGDPAVILIACLFVVSEGLDATGVTAWVGQAIVARSGSGLRPLLLIVMVISAGLTAFIGLNGSVAALLPMAVVVALRRAVRPSKLLLPLAFAGSAGGLLLPEQILAYLDRGRAAKLGQPPIDQPLPIQLPQLGQRRSNGRFAGPHESGQINSRRALQLDVHLFG